MFAQLSTRTNALRLFFACAVVLILAYIAVLFYVPSVVGSTGLYTLPVQSVIIWIGVLAFVLVIVSIIVFAIRSHSLLKTGGLVVGALLLLSPLLTITFYSQLFREHVSSASAQGHVYQLAQDTLQTCPDTFDAQTMYCYHRVYVYQCDGLGLLCTMKASDLLIKHEKPLHLQVVGDNIQVIGDGDTVVYEMLA